VRPAAARVASSAPDRPVLSSAFLVRGVTWYTGRAPRVISNRPQPFWTRHPVPVVQGLAALPAFVREHGETFCVTRLKEWRDLERVPHPPLALDSTEVGDKRVTRATPG
jgi:hypothetical protein